jgi:drug/metabolite transporter (DMT)-like permease
LILLATLLWAFETIVARRVLPDLPATLAATARMAGGAIVMWAYVIASGRSAGMQSLSLEQWGWVVATSILLFGYVTTWYAALKQAPATIVTSLLTAGAVITAALNALEGNTLAGAQVIGLSIMLAGLVWTLYTLRVDRRRDVQVGA